MNRCRWVVPTDPFDSLSASFLGGAPLRCRQRSVDKHGMCREHASGGEARSADGVVGGAAVDLAPSNGISAK